MAHDVKTRQNKDAIIPIPTSFNLTGHTFLVQVDDNEAFTSPTTMGSATYADGVVVVTFSASNVNTIGDGYYRVRVTRPDSSTFYLTRGQIDYTTTNPSVTTGDVDGSGYLKENYVASADTALVVPYAASPSSEGANLYGYGHSYLGWTPGMFGQPGIVAGQRYVDRTFNRLGFGSYSNRATGGYRMLDASLDALGNRDAARTWQVGTHGYVVVDATTNDVCYNGGTTAALQGYEHSLRSLLALLSLASYRDDTDALIVKSNTFANPLNDFRNGTSTNITPGTTGYMDHFVNGPLTIWVGLGGVPGTAGTFDVKLNGNIVKTQQIGNQFVGSPDISGVNRQYGPIAVRVDVPAGTNHKITVMPTGGAAATTGAGPLLDYIGVQSSTPPAIFVSQMVYITNYGAYPGGASDATVDAYNTRQRAVCAEFPHVVVVDPRAGWNKSTMLSSDGVHPNAFGHAYLANVLCDAIKNKGYGDGYSW